MRRMVAVGLCALLIALTACVPEAPVGEISPPAEIEHDSGDKQPEGSEVSPGVFALYAPVLENWEKAIEENFGYSNGILGDTYYYPFVCNYLPNEFAGAHYAYYDIDGNGTPELLIASFYDFEYYHLIDVFAIHDGAPVRLFEGVEDRGFWSRNRLDFSADGKTLIVDGSSGAAYTTTDFYRVAENGYQVELLEGLATYNPEEQGGYNLHYRLPDGSYEVATDYDGVMEKYYGTKYLERNEIPDYYSDFHAQIEWKLIVQLEPFTIELAAELYSRFLEGEISSADGTWLSRYYDLGRTKDIFMVRDLTGDGIPEIYHQAPHPIASIWGIENEQIVYIAGLATYHSLLANGGIFYHRPGAATTHDDYWYHGLSPESKAYPDVSFNIYYAEAYHPVETCFLNGEEVTREEWQAVADVYFALRDAEPDEAQCAVVFSEWIDSIDVNIEPLPLSASKASRIYLSFFRHVTYSEYDLKGVTQFLIWDFTGDGIPEVYLPIYSRDVWTIRGTDVVLLGTLDDMGVVPEYPISFLEWCDGTIAYERPK